MENHKDSSPCLVETRRGFSVLFKNKPLYSKYAPEEQIKKILSSTKILPNTLILCFSPLLGYGLEELFSKLPENCYVLAIEKDNTLFDFSLSCKESKIQKSIKSQQNFLYINPISPLHVAKLIHNINSKDFPKIGNFRRCLPIDFSGGTQLYLDFYKEITTIVDDSISQFWRNRTTLIKLGRLYAGNFFKNLQDIANSNNKSVVPIKNLHSLTKNKNILVLGTGLSLESFLQNTQLQIANKSFRDNLFIIAVDASLQVLKKFNIIPDLVVGVEGQIAIEKAYIGFNNSKVSLAQDLLSRPSIKRTLKGNCTYFLSKYTDEDFFSDFTNIAKKLNIPIIQPLGSVGLVAIELALYLKHETTNIYFCGLDFSFMPGKTHSNGSLVHTNLLSNCTKISPLEQFGNSFNTSNFSLRGKSFNSSQNNEITSKALYDYAQHFIKRYSSVKNLYDLTNFGIISGLASKSTLEFINETKTHYKKNLLENTPAMNINTISEESTLKIKSQQLLPSQDILELKSEGDANIAKHFLKECNQRLTKIKNILTGKEPSYNLEDLLNQSAYLFLHFPDGHLGAKLTEDFLKRVRAELNYFIKITEDSFSQKD